MDNGFYKPNGPTHRTAPPSHEREDSRACGEYRMQREVGQSPDHEKQPDGTAQQMSADGPTAKGREFDRLR